MSDNINIRGKKMTKEEKLALDYVKVFLAWDDCSEDEKAFMLTLAIERLAVAVNLFSEIEKIDAPNSFMTLETCRNLNHDRHGVFKAQSEAFHYISALINHLMDRTEISGTDNLSERN